MKNFQLISDAVNILITDPVMG